MGLSLAAAHPSLHGMAWNFGDHYGNSRSAVLVWPCRELRVGWTVFQAPLTCLLAVGPQMCSLTPLGLSFVLCEMGVT